MQSDSTRSPENLSPHQIRALSLKAVTPDMPCAVCGITISRGPKEQASKYIRRQTCSKKCAAQLPSRNKKIAPPPDVSPMRQCQGCGGEFTKRRDETWESFATRTRCSKACFDQHLRGQRASRECGRTCQICGVPLTIHPDNESARMFAARKTCGRACGYVANATTQQKEIPLQKTCIYCGEFFERRLHESRHKFSIRTTCTLSCAQSASRGTPFLAAKSCVMCGNTFHRRDGQRLGHFRLRSTCSRTCQSDLCRQVRTTTIVTNGRTCAYCSAPLLIRPGEIPSNYMKRMTCGVSCGRGLQHSYTFQSSIERETYEALRRLGIRFQPQKKIGKYFVDAFLVGRKTIVECLGDYWHVNPAKYPAGCDLTEQQLFNLTRDPIRMRDLRSRGFEVIELWEQDIKFEGAESLLRKSLLIQ
jgi:very-short-patch-repair endonuclease